MAHEIDLRPSGRFVRAIDGIDDDGNFRYHERESEEGDIIASGTTDAEGYGTTPVERAQFIVDTVRIHLTRQTCTHHVDALTSIEAVLGAELRWCPTCGIRLPLR
jgi:hypothetical protein